jgi:hypothetical protein
MVKEFEMKKSADIFSRISIAKTGVIDTTRFILTSTTKISFVVSRSIPSRQEATGFVMVLDWSGSMTDNIKETVKQLIQSDLVLQTYSD